MPQIAWDRRQWNGADQYINLSIHRSWKRQNLLVHVHIILYAICLGKVGGAGLMHFAVTIYCGGFPIYCRVIFLIQEDLPMQCRSLPMFMCLDSSRCCLVGNYIKFVKICQYIYIITYNTRYQKVYRHRHRHRHTNTFQKMCLYAGQMPKLFYPTSMNSRDHYAE